MTVVGFTAARAIRDGDKSLIERVLASSCTQVDVFVTGACVGGDQYIASTVHDW